MIVACEGNREVFMNRYIEEECKECDEYFLPYGCLNHSCPIYQGRLEMEADKECDRRREDRIMEAKDDR